MYKMKKLNVLIIVALLAGVLLAANPAGRLVRLEIYNKTDFPVYIKLEGQETGAFYYLTVPGTTSDTSYIDKTFTILTDVYDRTTWACDGIKSEGELWMTGNVRLVFTPCGQVPLRWIQRYYYWDYDMDGFWDYSEGWLYRVPNFGEPTMEKVWYWKEYSFDKWVKTVDPTIVEGLLGQALGYWWFDWDENTYGWYGHHFTLWIHLKAGVDWRTYKGPLGVWWRYKY
jgi:hypothetical protein